MPKVPAPPIPPSPPTSWPEPATAMPRTADGGWLGVPEREAWTGWQVALVTVVALLAGLAIGVALGLRLDDGRPTPATASAAIDAMPRGETPFGGRPFGESSPGSTPDEADEQHLGTPANPVPIGIPFILGGYTLEVLAVDPLAADAVVRHSELNVAPAAGESYVVITVELTYDGPFSGDPIDVLLSTEDQAGDAYLEHRNSCGRIPDPLLGAGDLGPGESAVGNVCFAVPTERLPGMTLIAEVLAGYPVHYQLDG